MNVFPQRGTSTLGKQPLKCKVMHHKVLAHQVAALSIMGWLGDITEKSGQIDPQ